jgi:hypothetical protein
MGGVTDRLWANRFVGSGGNHKPALCFLFSELPSRSSNINIDSFLLPRIHRQQAPRGLHTLRLRDMAGCGEARNLDASLLDDRPRLSCLRPMAPLLAVSARFLPGPGFRDRSPDSEAQVPTLSNYLPFSCCCHRRRRRRHGEAGHVWRCQPQRGGGGAGFQSSCCRDIGRQLRASCWDDRSLIKRYYRTGSCPVTEVPGCGEWRTMKAIEIPRVVVLLDASNGRGCIALGLTESDGIKQGS